MLKLPFSPNIASTAASNRFERKVNYFCDIFIVASTIITIWEALSKTPGAKMLPGEIHKLSRI